VNTRSDELALSALMAALMTQTFIKDLFPSKGVIVFIGTERITGSPKAEMHLWGEQVAQELFHWRGIVHTNDFPLVYWEGMDKGSRRRSGYGLQSMSPTSMAQIGCSPGFQLLKPMPKSGISVRIADVLMNLLHTLPVVATRAKR
jgi:hypothetical protein